MRTFIFYLKFEFSMIVLAVLSYFKIRSKYKECEKTGNFSSYDDMMAEIVGNWAKQRVKDSGSDVTVYGLENIPKDRNAVYISNHQSNFDIPVLLAYIPVKKGFIAKKELAKIPFLHMWMRRIHCLFIDREDMKQSLKIILEGIEMIKKGYNLVLFPEGTRSKSNTMGEFKQGGLKLATKPKALIVPVTIDGTYKVLEGSKHGITPSHINLYIHPVVDTAALSKEETSNLAQTLHDTISSKLPKESL